MRKEAKVQISEAKVDGLLRTAIEQRRLIRLVYQNKDRILEPHDYGIHNGAVKLLAYQIAGPSGGRLANWRWLDTRLISDLRVLDQPFPGGRPTPSGKHQKWDKLFIRVRPPDEGEIRKADVHLPHRTGVGPDNDFVTWDSARLAHAIGRLGYPQFHSASRASTENVAVVLLAALGSDDLEVRIVEALPWLVVHYSDLDWKWLIPRARQIEAQNRLGFVVTLGRRMAEKVGNQRALKNLRKAENNLKKVRVIREGTLCQASLSDAERRWLRRERSENARFWYLLTDLDSEHLFHEA
jgi:hypothetical protein